MANKSFYKTLRFFGKMKALCVGLQHLFWFTEQVSFIYVVSYLFDTFSVCGTDRTDRDSKLSQHQPALGSLVSPSQQSKTEYNLMEKKILIDPVQPVLLIA